MTEKNKYKVINFIEGLYEYDTIHLEFEKNIIQIPIKKELVDSKIIGKYITIDKIDRPLEKNPLI